MSDKTDVKVNVSTLGEEVTLTLLHGQAPKVNEPVGYTETTTLEGPFKYFNGVGKHYPEVDKRAVVLANLTEASIILAVNPHDELSAKVKGVMKENPDLAPFHINSATKRFTGDELTALLRSKGHVLNIAPAESRAFTGKFANLKSKITKEMENVKDDTGNVVDNFIQKVSSDAVKAIPFKAPLHVGCPVKEFSVEVGIEAANRGVVFYLFSSEYAQELYDEKVDKLSQESKRFESAGICVIESF